MDVIATAMVSSLGYGVRTACAAARAGLSRAGELPFTVLENDGSPGLAIGHAAHLVSGGFEGDPRLIRLLSGAVHDLLQQLSPEALAVPSIAFYLALPPRHREHEGLNLILDEDARPLYLERLGERPQIDDRARGVRILDSAMRMAGWPGRITAAVRTVRVSTSGHSAVIELYQRAQAELEAGGIDLAIVGGVDSLLCPATLSWLQLTGRLKGAESPAGLAPGEAAAFVAIGGPSRGTPPPDPPRARIDRIVVQSSATQFLAGDPADGKSLARVMQSLINVSEDAAPTPWVIADQNGEMFRASDWGCSLVHLRGAGKLGDGAPNVWYPAASFGDTGAATGAVATCLAVAAYERRYAPEPRGVILTSNDGGQRAGCVVSA